MSTEQGNERLCDCRSRVGPHDRFDTLEAWIVFLVTKGVLSSDIMDRVHDAGLDTNDLFVRLLYSQWHTGRFPTDLVAAKRLIAGWVFDPQCTPDAAWEKLRTWLVEQEGGTFCFPALEEVRAHELSQMTEQT
jgi:hypothetical protein